MDGQDQRRVFRDHQCLGRDLDTLPPDRLDLFDEMPRVQHDAIADHRQFATPDNAGWQGVKFVDLFADNQRVTRVVPALKARDDVSPFGQPIDDFAFALIAPLCANYNYVSQKLMLNATLFTNNHYRQRVELLSIELYRVRVTQS